MQIRFKIRGVKEVQKYLKTLPRGAMRTALDAIARWLIGDSQSGLAHPEPYKYVSRKSAYGFSFFTDKQRRWFFWALSEGIINPGQNNRTGKSTNAWTYKPTETNKGYSYRLINDTAGAYFTRDDYGQARQPAKVGWKKVSEVVNKNMKGALRAATAAVNTWLKNGKH
ncbi:MAG: hypothetical protein NUV80_07550 [Candidatus Berkelbacteria bacterium]|nr:hypothetical protein [Candidatus Berkelbacteria bacterium]